MDGHRAEQMFLCRERRGVVSARWVEELRLWANEGVTHFLCDFGHVTETEPVLRFARSVRRSSSLSVSWMKVYVRAKR